MNLTDIYRIFHLVSAEGTSFSSAFGIFSRIDHVIGYKANINKLKKIEVIPTIFSNHNDMKLDISKRKVRGSINLWKLDNVLLSNHWVKEEMKGEIKIMLKMKIKMEI